MLFWLVDDSVVLLMLVVVVCEWDGCSVTACLWIKCWIAWNKEGKYFMSFLAFLYIQQYERESKRVSNVLLKCCLIIFLMHTHLFLHVRDRITKNNAVNEKWSEM